MNQRYLILILFVLTILLPACAGAAELASPPTARDAVATPTVVVLPSPTPRPTTAIDKLGLTGTPVDVDIMEYRLIVDGLVEKPLSLTYEQVLAYPAVSRLMALECPGFFVDFAEWTGPLVRSILEDAGVKPDAREVVFYDGDEFAYEKVLSLEEALRDNTLLAYQVNGVTLPVEHGYPLRLAAGDQLGDVWVKWLFHIEVK